MKASVSSWSYRERFNSGEMDLMSFLDEAARIGADGFEIFARHYDHGKAAEQLGEAVEKGRRLGLEVASLIAANDFACPGAADRAEQVARFVRCIEAAGAAGIERINCFTGHHGDGQDPFMEAARVVDAFREVAPLAEEKGVKLCVENHSSVNRDADGLLAILRAVGSDAMRTNPDPSNFVRGFQQRPEPEREPIYSETAKIAPLAANAHLKVGDFTDDGEHAFLDVGRIVEIFKQAGYEGHVSLEVYGREHSQNPADVCSKGLALLRKHM